ncbi:MAG: hypothetical protein LBQ67_01650, partial [Treponema sp.]|nr:hypothetical protein [Treponema sp.]
SYDPKTKYYTLNYGGAYTNNETKQLAAASLDALLAEMRKARTDFDETGIQSVRAQAALIPSYVYAEWQRLGSADALAVIKGTLTNFYTSPTQNNYNAILEIAARYVLRARDEDNFASIAHKSFMNTLRNLNQVLSSSVFQDSPLMYQVAARTPTIAGFEVFSIPYRGGQR